MANPEIHHDEDDIRRPVARVEIIHPADLPEWQRRTKQAGRTLDHWHPVPGHPEIVAVRMLNSPHQCDLAQSYRQLELEPDEPATLT